MQDAKVTFGNSITMTHACYRCCKIKPWQGLSLTSGVLQQPTSPVTQQMLAAAQLRAEYVIAEFHALQMRAHIEQQESSSKINKLQEAREELQKAMEEQGKVR